MLGEVTLTSGATASYYVDAKRAILRQPGFGALAELVAAEAGRVGASAVGGMTMGADPIASAAISDPAGRELLAFFVRKERKEHGLQRWIEGPPLDPGARCLVVEDVVTTGGSTVSATSSANKVPPVVSTAQRPRESPASSRATFVAARPVEISASRRR